MTRLRDSLMLFEAKEQLNFACVEIARLFAVFEVPRSGRRYMRREAEVVLSWAVDAEAGAVRAAIRGDVGFASSWPDSWRPPSRGV